jgi:hypothetical protein
VTFTSRATAGTKAEQEFARWVHLQPGWHLEQYGQGLANQATKLMMRQAGFNGDTALLEQLLAGMHPEVRRVYMDRIETIPCLTRWMPDYVMAFRNELVCAPDVKTSLTPSPNWAVDVSSVLGAKLHSRTGVQCVYAFPPNDRVPYWSCATPGMIDSFAYRVMDGRNAAGSGTPFYLIPKSVCNFPLKRVMTEIELNGRCELGEAVL